MYETNFYSMEYNVESHNHFTFWQPLFTYLIAN